MAELSWKACPSFPDYEVSEDGDVRRVRGGYGPKVICQEERPVGYFSVRIQNETGWRHANVHRLVAETFLGRCPEGKRLVAHIDGNGKNNHFSNLRWSTHKENEQDKIRHQRNPRGSRAGASVLNEGQVKEIKHLLLSGVSQPQIAKKFGVARTTVSNISIGKNWSWLHV